MKLGQKSVILLVLAILICHTVDAQLIAEGDTIICQGGSAHLTAEGGGASYYWTSFPPDPSLLIPQQQNPVVSPQVNTMYVVQSNIATGNLILNGTFELGVMGFNSDYVNNQTSIVAEGTYAVVNDAHTVHPNFFCNHDHTSGNGKMMAVNGAGVANVKVWYLSLNIVQPHTRYEFSTWITSLHNTNPALLQFSINGQLMGQPFQAYSTTCDWYQFFYIWDSDTNHQATISIVNQNTILSGNDFALDDISFATVLVYYDTVYVEVLPQFNSPFVSPSEACAQETVTVEYTGNAPDTADFHWDFDGGAILSGTGPGPYEISYGTAGNPTISLWVDGAGCASDTSYQALAIGESPLVTVSADQTLLPYGASTTLHGAYSGGLGPFNYTWQPAALLTDPASLDPQTVAMEYTTSFILAVEDQSANCTGYDTVVVEVAGGPLGINASAVPDEICPGEQAVLTAQGLGGTGNYSYSWTSDPPGFNSTLPSVTVQPDVTTEYTVSVSDGLSVVDITVTVTVNQDPQAFSGADITIPYGTNTSLQGTGIGGSGAYTYHWEPAGLLINPNSSSTSTINLTSTTVFSLIVTDFNTGCISMADEVVVYIQGGPLSVNIDPSSPAICKGDTATLTAYASGGNAGSYSYSWTDNFGNTHPSSQTITVNPYLTTTYHVSVYDGFNTTVADLTLTVNPSTEFLWSSGPGIINACPLDTVDLLPVPNPDNWNYIWSDGSTGNHLVIGSTGIGYEQKTITLTTSNSEGCTFTLSVMVIFDFSYCSGIGDDPTNAGITIVPNPTRGTFRVMGSSLVNFSGIDIFTKEGRLTRSEELNGKSREIEIDLGGLPAGIYIVRFNSATGVAYRKVILIR